MKPIGELMKELGFREEGSADTKRAFIENLVRAATGEKWSSLKKTKPSPNVGAPHLEEPKEEQLSFEFDHEPAPSSLFTRKSG